MVLASILAELLEPIIKFLECLALWMLGGMEWVGIQLLNLVIFSLGGLISLALLILPEVELSELSHLPYLALVEYVFPLEYLIGLCVFLLGIEITIWAVRIALRLARAVT